MDRSTFGLLCEMLRDVGSLKPTRNTTIEEVVAQFLYVLAHYKKSRTISVLFLRSREAVRHQFSRVLLAVLKLHELLLKKPEPITDECQDEKWRYFKGCLGALDGTLVSVTQPKEEKSRYRTRKGTIATNVLGVCCPNKQFIYVLAGWEGSAHDGLVLRDAISRPHGFRVSQGGYYLVDVGYCNAKGFLAPYRGQRYHLNEFGSRQLETAQEFFNMKHSKARNCIKKCFGLLKGRWKILASPSFFSIQTQVRIIMACCLLHNLIRRYMSFDPQEAFMQEEVNSEDEQLFEDNEDYEEQHDETMNIGDYITHIAPSDEWVAFRKNLSNDIFNNWNNIANY